MFRIAASVHIITRAGFFLSQSNRTVRSHFAATAFKLKIRILWVVFFLIFYEYVLLRPSYGLFQPVVPDGQLPGEGFMLLLDLQLRGLQTQGFPGLHLLDAAIAQAALAFLHLSRQRSAAALYRVAAGHQERRESES